MMSKELNPAIEKMTSSIDTDLCKKKVAETLIGTLFVSIFLLTLTANRF